MSSQHTSLLPEGGAGGGLPAITTILDSMSPLIPPLLLGVLTHATFLRVHEVEQFMYTLIFSTLALLAGVFLSYIFPALGNMGFLAALKETAGLAGVFAAGVYGSMLVYRAWLHPLRGFRGPFGARLTRFWSVRQAARDVQYYKVVDGLFGRYGDVFRTGPRELCIVRSAAVPLIYGPRSRCCKSTWYAQVDVKNKECSVHMTRDFESHRMRRRAWDQGFSVKALNTYIPRITDKVDTFLSQITRLSAAASGGTGVDASSWTMLLTFDIMGKVGFSKDFRGVETGVEHPAIKCIHDHMTVMGVVSHTPWLLNMIPRIPGAGAGFAPFFKWCKSEVQAKKKSLDPNAYPQDIVSWLMKAFLEKSPTAAPTEAALDDDSRAVIIAGSDTTATTLAWILYYFCKNPRVLAKLHAQVDAVMPGSDRRSVWSYDKAKQIPYIDDIINEALRIKPALLTGGYRETPAEGLQIEDVFIPGGINVFVPIRQIQNDERYWTQPDEFVPERWSERREEMGTEGAPWLPFNMGAYACPGKALAMMTMRIVLSRFAQECTVNFAAGEDGVEFEAGAMDTFTTTLLPLQLEFHKRE